MPQSVRTIACSILLSIATTLAPEELRERKREKKTHTLAEAELFKSQETRALVASWLRKSSSRCPAAAAASPGCSNAAKQPVKPPRTPARSRIRYPDISPPASQQTTKMELNCRLRQKRSAPGTASPPGRRGEAGARCRRCGSPGQRSQPGVHLPRYRRASTAPRTQHLFTYCRASGTSYRCPARTIKKKSRSVLVDKLLDPLPLVYNIGHSCNRGQKRSPEKSGLPLSGRVRELRAAGQLRRAAAGPCGGTLRGAGLRSASSEVSAPPRRTKPGHPATPHNLCGGAAAHWLRRTRAPPHRISLGALPHPAQRPPRTGRALPAPQRPRGTAPHAWEGSLCPPIPAKP